MDLENSLKKMRIQIKFDRLTGVRASLTNLLNEHTGSDHEAEILEVFALGFLRSINDYGSAVPLLQRLLSLDISQELRQRASEFILECERKAKIVPSQPDRNNPLFVEFIELVRSGNLFKSAPSLSMVDRYFVTKDLAEAQKLAWHQGIDNPFVSWNGLRSQAAKQVYTYYFENKISMDLIDDQVSAEITRICERSIPKGLMDFYDDIYGDLVEIARGKLVEVTTDLHKIMWDAYRNSIFPCGWKGAYPEGALCVFLPPE